VLFYKPGYYLENPAKIVAMWEGGMSFHGGAIGVLIAVALYCRGRDISFLSFADLITAAAPIGLFFGRIANFINGELFGRIADVPWAMAFPRGGPAPRHPSQLYEAGLEGLVLFAVLAALIFGCRALRRPGLVTGAFFAGYGIARFVVEYVREPDEHLGTLLGIATMGQILSLPLIALGAWMIHRAIRRA
jgi:phosphatidylglycerol:prolipoprotein diacylglycerol transferase